MGFRIKELRVGRKSSFRLLLAVELFLLAVGIVGLFGRNAVYEFGVGEVTADLGTYSEEEGGYTVSEVEGSSGVFLSFDGISLPKGVYRISLQYSTDTNLQNLCRVSDDSVAYMTLLANYDVLYSGLHETDFNIWLLTAQDDISIQVIFCGAGSLTVTGLVISETNALSRMMIFCVLVASTIVNALYLFCLYDRRYHVALKTKICACSVSGECCKREKHMSEIFSSQYCAACACCFR